MEKKINSYAEYKKRNSSGKQGIKRTSSQIRINKAKEENLSKAENNVRQNRETTKKSSRIKKSKNTKKIQKTREEIKQEKLIKKQTKLENKKARKEERAQMYQNFKDSFKPFMKRIVIFMSILIIVSEVLFLLNSQTKLDKIQFDINDLSSKMEKRNNELKELNAQKESAYKSETIENLARYKLGMTYPTKEQTVYIYLD